MAEILVIDDDEIVNDMISQLLLEAGFGVASASNGKQGLQKLGEGAFDLVITDIVMPEMEGLETILEIHKKYPALPIIAVSGGGRIGPDQYLAMAQGFGARYVFRKPFDNALFLNSVSECLKKG